MQEEGVTNEGKYNLLSLHKQEHAYDKSRNPGSLHMYIYTARLTACEMSILLIHNSATMPTLLLEEPLKFITHGCIFGSYIISSPIAFILCLHPWYAALFPGFSSHRVTESWVKPGNVATGYVHLPSIKYHNLNCSCKASDIPYTFFTNRELFLHMWYLTYFKFMQRQLIMVTKLCIAQMISQ